VNLRVASLPFIDDVVLLASSSQDLQRALELFRAGRGAARMKVSSSKFEAVVLKPEKGGVLPLGQG